MATIAEEEKKRKLGNAGIPVPPAMDPGPMVGKPADFTNRVQPPAIQPAAPVVNQPVGGAAFGVPPSMGRRPASPVVMPAPAAPVPLEQRLGWRTDAVMNGAAEDASAAFGKGNYGETAGALVRGAATAIPAAVVDFGEGLAGGVVPAAQGFVRGLTGGQAPAAQAVPAAKPIAQAAPAQGNPNARTDVQRAGAEAPATAPDGSPLVADSASGIRRIDAPGKSPLFTNLPANDPSNQALMARGFGPTAQSTAAAQNLSDRYAGESRGAMAVDQYNAEVAAAQQANQAGLAGTLQIERRMQRDGLLKKAAETPSRSKANAMVSAANNMEAVDQRAGEADARTAVEGRKVDQQAAQFGMTNQLAQQKAAGEQTKLGFEAQSVAQIQAASDALMTAKTPAERQNAMETLAGLQGKYSPKDTQNRFTVVPGGQAIDEKTGMPYTVPARALDNQTGRFVDQAPSAQKTTPTAASIAKLKANPAMAKQFDEMFGAGAAAAALK